MEVVNFLMSNYMEVLGALLLVLGGVVALLKLVPGEQPGESLLVRIYSSLKKLVGK